MPESHDNRPPATRLSAVIRTEIGCWLTMGYEDVLSINDGSCEEFAQEVLLHPDCPKAPGIRIYETFDLRRVASGTAGVV
jgi:hypothetical protein